VRDAVAEALHIAENPIRRAAGGPVTAADTRLSQGVSFTHGLLHSAGPGRTDTLPVNVLSGSYVLPADIVSGLGQGNTLAGTKHLDRIFADLLGMDHIARSGKGPRVPIIAAGGEYIIQPEAVRFLGGGDIKRGHAWLDDFVKDVRERTHKTLGKLPGPAK
jgi:hypothetical protein